MCVFFENDLDGATTCPSCGSIWYKNVEGKKLPMKVVRWFPLKPWLKRMLQCNTLPKLMTWHSHNTSQDGLVRHVPNSWAWKHIDETWPKFVNEPWNVHLGLGIDGVYLYSSKNSCWSTWPLISLCYNLPPWLMTKKKFTMLLLFILDKKLLWNANIDVYLTPLIEELQELWEGIHAHDVLRPLGERHLLFQYMISNEWLAIKVSNKRTIRLPYLWTTCWFTMFSNIGINCLSRAL
jgi:hypothetical protein